MNDRIIAAGADDLDIRLFENQYPVPEGMSYNSWLVIGPEKIAVMDAIDAACVDRWLGHISENLPEGRKPDYLVVQHMEPDHSAGIARFMEEYPGATIVASTGAVNMLANFFPGLEMKNRAHAVKEGETLRLGPDSELKFFMAPMVHWPEVMVTWHAQSGTLFSADAFGSFGFTQGAPDRWPDEARRYYVNIVGKYGPQVQALLKKASALPIKTIAPLHGAVLADNLAYYIGLYDNWSRYEPEETDGVLVAYTSIYGGTARVADMIADEVQKNGRKVIVCDLLRGDISEAVAQAFRMGTMVLCAVTYDASIMPAMRDFLSRLSAKRLCRRRVALVQNGSWAPIAAKTMADALAGCPDMTFLEPVVTIHSRFKESDRPQLQELINAVCTHA